jgi:tetratricopeptide (TPR) repeat protein/predicted Ser/Thr protein kinase
MQERLPHPLPDPLPERALDKLLAVGAAGEAPAPPPHIPDRYRIVRELGRGGMGVVYEAFDQQLGRTCALKMIGASAGAGDELRRRFAREAQAAARLRHPHIAAVYDATPDYISMQLIAGCPIDAVHLGERRLLVELVRDAARALHHAHEQGIVHRDVKPSNLLVEGQHVFVVDFGLAKQITTDGSLSLPGTVLGTPAFMPPEQARGLDAAVDARSDVYALGATLYRCLTGSPPFADTDLPQLLRRVVEDDPPAPRIERDLDVVLMRSLAKEPERRYPSAAAFADDLERWLRSEPVQARRPSLGYRLRKLVQRKRALFRAAGFAALGAVLLTALVLVPIALRENDARAAASEAVALSYHAAALFQDAAVFTRLGDLPSAHRALETGIDETRAYLDRHNVPRVRHLLSRLLRARGRSDEAAVELERALDVDPGLDEARFEHGLMLAAQPALTDAERARAIDDLSTTIRARSVLTNVDILFGRAELHRLRGEAQQSKAVLEEVLAYDPTHVAARMSLAHVALALGDEHLASQYSVSAVDLQLGYGPIYLMRERQTLPTTILGLEAALVDFGTQLADGPDNALALAHRGLVQLRRGLRLEAEGARSAALGAFEDAIGDYDLTLELHPDLAGALNNRAVCLMQAQRLRAATGDIAGAAEASTLAARDLERALAESPGLTEALLNAGLHALRKAQLLRKLGRATAAATELDRAGVFLRDAQASAPPGWPHLRTCRARADEAEALRGQTR